MSITRILITGGSGYIGSSLIQKALDLNYIVNVIDNSDLAIQDDRIQFFKGSILDAELLSASLAGVDVVYHLAGVSDGRQGKLNPEWTKKVNSDSIDFILAAAQKASVKRFFFASTFGVYGNQYSSAITEDFPLNPVDPYSLSKAICEEKIFKANQIDFLTCSFRIGMVYGLGPKLRLDFLINNLCQQAVQSNCLKIVGGQQRRPQVHIQDLCSILTLAAEMDATKLSDGVFNVVSSNPSVAEIATTIKEIVPSIKLEMEPSVQVIESFMVIGSKLEEKTGFHYSIDLKNGIEELITHFIKSKV